MPTLGPAMENIKECGLPTGCSEVSGQYADFLPLLMFLLNGCTDLPKTHQGHQFIS